MSRLGEFTMTGVVVMILLWFTNMLVQPHNDVRNLEFMPNMVYSKALESFSESALLPDGITQQALVEGVLPRGVEVFPYGVGQQEATRAGEQLQNPFAEASSADLDRGRRLYGVYCSVCHDDRGDGTGQVVLHGRFRPPSLSAARAKELPDGTLFHILTRGQGNMASYEAQLSADDRWRVVRWVRQLQGGNQ